MRPNSPQAWVLDAPAPGFVSNTVGGASTCLNLYGCQPRLITYPCTVGQGCSSGQGFVFALSPTTGALTAPLLPGLCAAPLADGVTLAMQPCNASAPGQQWAHAANTGQLINAASGLCLTSPLEDDTYVRVCLRVSGYTGFAGLAPVPGYCLRLRVNGTWDVSVNGTALGGGAVAAYTPTQPTPLVLAARGTALTAYIGGVQVGAWADGTIAAGMVAVGSGVHQAVFDDLFVRDT